MMTLQEIDAVELPGDVQAELDGMLGRDVPPDGGADQLTPEDRQLLKSLSNILVEKRKEAIDGRKMSGIEDIWAGCEDAHESIDDMNRGEIKGERWQKPLTMEGPLTSSQREQEDPNEQPRSNVFVPVTRRYVGAGWSKVCEILLPPDDKAFSIESTPVPDLIKGKDDTRQVSNADGTLLTRDATKEEIATDQAAQPFSPQVPPEIPPQGTAQPPDPQLAPASGGAPASLPPGKPLQMRDLAKEKMQEAEASAKEAETLILDWMVEGRYTAGMRKVAFDAAKLGVGVMKSPYSIISRSVATQKETDDAGKDTITAKIIEKVLPGSKRVNPWHFFPDPSCGEDVQTGEYCWERDFITESTLKGLTKEKGYVEELVAQVIKEGPGKRYLDEKTADRSPYDHRYEIWYFEGFLHRDEILLLNPSLEKEIKETTKTAMMICSLVNDTVIRGVLHPLQSGTFSYKAIPWSRRTDHWAGVGVAEQIFMPQLLINAGTRAWIDNAGLSAGVQIVLDKVCIQPADGRWIITGNKLWNKIGDADTNDVAEAFQTFTFPNVGAALEALVMYGFKLCEECSNIPLITQGQSGDTTPDTFGAAQLQNSNANQMLRSVADNFDDYGTEPTVLDHYEWLLMDPNVPNSAKGDFKINAHGSAALVERHIQNQVVQGLFQFVPNPAYKIDPKKLLEEYLRGNKLTPAKFQFSKEEQDRMDSTPPPKDIKLQIAELQAQVQMMRTKMDVDRDSVYVKAESERTQIERDTRLAELEAKTKLELLKYANQRQISLEEVRAGLAETTMKLSVQKQLAAQDKAGEALAAPNEPPGRAPTGQSFEK